MKWDPSSNWLAQGHEWSKKQMTPFPTAAIKGETHEYGSKEGYNKKERMSTL